MRLFRRKSPYYVELVGVKTNLPRVRLNWHDDGGVLNTEYRTAAKVYTYGRCAYAWLCHDKLGRIKGLSVGEMRLEPGDIVSLHLKLSAEIK